jgi:apolipoprotein N-acyltransferase
MRIAPRVYRPAFALLAGVMLALAFPHPGWGPLGAVALVPLVWSLRGAGWWHRALLGLLCGAVFYSYLVYWLVYVHSAAAPLVCLWLSLWLAAFGILCGPLRSSGAMVLWMPTAWVCVEYLRSIGPLSFAWGLLGHTQWQNLPLIQAASLTGVYGVSFLLAMTSGAMAAFPVWFRGRKPVDGFLLVFPFVLLLGVWTAGIRAAQTRETGDGSTLRLALIQTCLTQHEKWDEKEFDRVKARTYRLSHEAAGGDVDLIVWPETALPLAINEWPEVEEELIGEVRAMGKPVLVGSLIEHGEEAGSDLRNAVFLYRSDTSSWEKAQRYEKMHLVPWGEYVPLKNLFPFVDRMVSEEGGGGLSPGKVPTVFRLNDASFGAPVCFESAVPGLVGRFVAGGAGLLINVTNDAWFRESSAQEQHAIQSVFRAVENRRAVARAANTGLTCWISPTGEIKDQLPLYEPGFLLVEVRLCSGTTFYTRHGDLFARVILVVAAAFGLYYLLRERKRRGGPAK